MRYVLDELNVLTENARMFNPNVFALPAIVMGDFNQQVSATEVKSKYSHHYQVDVKCGSRRDQLVAYRSPIYTPLLDVATCCIEDPDNPSHMYRRNYDNIVITPGACRVLGASQDQSELGIRRIKGTLRHSSDHMPVAARLTVVL
jgi:endonuclease/exonuclease/phosphatase family metal-dependent hydrolase